MKTVKILTVLMFGFLLGGFLGDAAGFDGIGLNLIASGAGLVASMLGAGLVGTNFIGTSVTWTGKQTYEKFIKPIFVGKSPLDTPGVRVMADIVYQRKLNYFAAASKVLKAYTKGWTTPASGSTYTQNTLTVVEMKAEMSQDANEFWQTVYGEAQAKGVEWNDVSKAPVIKQILEELFMVALESDIYREYWLNDIYKETISSGIYTGTADTNYNSFNGMWKTLIDNAATSPSATQIFRVAMSNGAVAQVSTITVTGTSGTANVAFNGVNYLATFDTTLTLTNTNFVALHAAALLLRGVVVTASVADLIFTSSIAGQPFTAPTITNATGNLAGSVAATTANTAPAALAADEALAAFKALFVGCNAVLKGLPTVQKVLLVTNTMYENYLSTCEGQNATYYWTSEDGRNLLINGAQVLKYRGVPVVQMGWDVHLDADFPTAYPHRAIYTEMNNLVLGIDAVSDFAQIEFWYNKDEQENRYRAQMKMGVQYIHNHYVAVAY